MYFCVIFHHAKPNPLLEWELLHFVNGFKNSRRAFFDSRDMDNRAVTYYYLEGPEEMGTLLILKGFETIVMACEPSLLVAKRQK